MAYLRINKILHIFSIKMSPAGLLRNTDQTLRPNNSTVLIICVEGLTFNSFSVHRSIKFIPSLLE